MSLNYSETARWVPKPRRQDHRRGLRYPSDHSDHRHLSTKKAGRLPCGGRRGPPRGVEPRAGSSTRSGEGRPLTRLRTTTGLTAGWPRRESTPKSLSPPADRDRRPVVGGFLVNSTFMVCGYFKHQQGYRETNFWPLVSGRCLSRHLLLHLY